MHLTDDFHFSWSLYFLFLYYYAFQLSVYFVIYLFTGLFKLSRISFPAAGFRLKSGLGKECIGALSGLPHGLESHIIRTSFGPGLDWTLFSSIFFSFI